MLCIFVVINVISGRLVSNFGLKFPDKQLETFQELFETKTIPVSSIISDEMTGNEEIDGLHNKIKSLIIAENTAVEIAELYSNVKWLKGVAMKKYAILHYEVPINMMLTIHAKQLKSECRFRYMSQYFDKTAFV